MTPLYYIHLPFQAWGGVRAATGELQPRSCLKGHISFSFWLFWAFCSGIPGVVGRIKDPVTCMLGMRARNYRIFSNKFCPRIVLAPNRLSICSILPYKWNNDRPRIVFAVSACAVYAWSDWCWRSVLRFPANSWGVGTLTRGGSKIRQGGRGQLQRRKCEN